MDLTGRRVGRYTVLRELGRGGMGAVYVARDEAVGREVALKVLLLPPDPVAVERFLREARAAARLNHPGIVAVHDAGVEAGLHYVVFDLVDGESLQDRLDRAGPLDPREAARLVAALAGAVAHAHAQGVLHRDIKPANALVARDGRVLLADFGLAKDAHAPGALTRTGELLGTPDFMAPEQAGDGARGVDARADVYGLGATLFALLTGQPPFAQGGLVQVLAQVLSKDPGPPSARRAGISPALDAVCVRAMAKRPDARFPTAAAFKTALVQAGRAGRRRRPLRWALAGAALLAVVAAPGLVVLLRPRDVTTPPEGTPARPVTPAPPVAAPAPPPAPAAAPPRWTWTEVARTEPWPEPRAATCCYDARHEVVLLVGGYLRTESGRKLDNTVWALAGGAWRRLGVFTVGTLHDNGLAADDDGRVVLFGGEARELMGGRVVVLGGWEPKRWDGEEWSALASDGEAPEARLRHAFVWAHDRHAFLVLGGLRSNDADALRGPRLSDLWELRSSGQWRRVEGRAPPARSSAAVAWVSRAGGRLVVYGGSGQEGRILDDLWEWDGERWVEVARHGPPGPRTEAAFVSDGRRCYLFGGLARTSGADPLPDNVTWAWDGATWTRLELSATSRTPPPRSRAGAAWDAAGGRLVLFGGVDPEPPDPSVHGVPRDDLWELRPAR